MYKLRPYQELAVEAGINHFKQNKIKGGLMVLPTGSGKSLVIASIAKELEGDTIVFQPSKEILEQNYAKIKSYGVEDVSIYSASIGEKNIGKITFAMIGSVINKKEQFKHFDNIIIDECHLTNAKGGMYEEFISSINRPVLGLTATPYRLTSREGNSFLKFLTRSRPRIFEKLIHYTQVRELYDQGYLSKLVYFEVDCIRPGEIKTNSTGAEFDDNATRRHLIEIGYIDRVVQVIKRLDEIGRKKILVFTRFVEDAKTIAEKVSSLGVKSTYVSGETPKKDREDILEKYTDMNSDLKVVFNVGVLSTGFDFPQLDTVVLARPTMSLALYYQQVGRGFRPHPEKDHCMIVDMAETYKKFGGVEELTIKDTGNEKRVVTNKRGRWLTNVNFK